ncbi:hypothetical protein [Micromonospora craterilacus]|uniref:hypothetical protein n=1 Tax=Micromonospora craterilacus TaxID=1655439 RepID=UPI001F2E3890|nr:hypothetical protein [Micromonospora craterilacus]
MLSHRQRDAIVDCLHGIDARVAAMHNWPGPVLFAWLRESPVSGHPDPTACAVTVQPLPVDPERWQNEPDGPVVALRQIVKEAHHSSHRAARNLQAGRSSKARALAYLFMYPTIIEHESDGPTEVRWIDAVDTDGTIYVLTRMLEADQGIVVTVADPGENEIIALLRRLITLTHPGVGTS